MMAGEEDCYLDVPSVGTPRLSETTACDYLTLWRDMISEYVMSNQAGNMVGGEGTTCEIDESLFGKRKYNRGRISARRQVWVIGGIVRCV